MRIVTTDIGGTHARFALATVEDGRVVAVDEPVTLKTSDHASFRTAWEEFARRCGEPLPKNLSIAFAGPVGGEVLKLTNNPWVIRPALIEPKLGVDRYTIVNDFGAVAHAVAVLGDEHLQHVCGPERGLPDPGGSGDYDVIETEGGHVDFAPLDSLEDRILAELRRNFRRVSIERIVSGRGLWNVYDALCAIENRPLQFHDEKALWEAALEGRDSLAAAALDRLCLSLGAVAGDLALAQGSSAVVIAGGVGFRLREHLPRSGFRDRFIAKGRFERRMDDMPVKLITHPNPGLLGAASAFAREHR